MVFSVSAAGGRLISSGRGFLIFLVSGNASIVVTGMILGGLI
jgi:hypothetical protein